MLAISAALYDRAMRGVEAGGVAAWRAALLATASGDVLEIGAGTGRNLEHYRGSLTRLVLAEPDRHMAHRLRRRLAAGVPLAAEVEVVDAPAESLPFAPASFDVVVSTLVLCSVADQAGALEEVRRVLRPGGRLLFLEHVAAAGRPRRLRWQRRCEPVWRRLAGNCHLTRDTERAIAAAGFGLSEVSRASMRKAPPIVRPTIRGTAVLPGPAPAG